MLPIIVLERVAIRLLNLKKKKKKVKILNPNKISL